jgi:hypothetical protein
MEGININEPVKNAILMYLILILLLIMIKPKIIHNCNGNRCKYTSLLPILIIILSIISYYTCVLIQYYL